MGSFFKEFKEFAMKGNVLDMAIGVIIGGAFGKIITSLVDNVLMPVIGTLVGSNFTELSCTINGAKVEYGTFIQNIVDFLIIAFCIFLFIKVINKLSKKKEEEPEAPAEPTNEEKLLTEIRDLLKKD